MCLSRLDQRPRKRKEFKQRVGWKVFYDTKDRDGKKGLAFEHYYHKRKRSPAVGRWMFSDPRKRRFDLSMGRKAFSYIPAFHIYLQKPDDKFYVSRIVVKVRWRFAVATGYQDSLPVVVAKKLLVPKNYRKSELPVFRLWSRKRKG